MSTCFQESIGDEAVTDIGAMGWRLGVPMCKIMKDRWGPKGQWVSEIKRFHDCSASLNQNLGSRIERTGRRWDGTMVDKVVYCGVYMGRFVDYFSELLLEVREPA